MTKNCLFVQAKLKAAGFKDLGYCACPGRVRRYYKRPFTIKAYGSACTLKLFERNNLIKQNVDYSQIEALIQQAV